MDNTCCPISVLREKVFFLQVRAADGSLLLSAYGHAADGAKLCGGGTELCSTVAFYRSADDGLTWTYTSRIDGLAAMVAHDKRGQHSDPSATGPAQASLALLGNGSLITAFRISAGSPGVFANESQIGPFFPGGNQGMNVRAPPPPAHWQSQSHWPRRWLRRPFGHCKLNRLQQTDRLIDRPRRTYRSDLSDLKLNVAGLCLSVCRCPRPGSYGTRSAQTTRRPGRLRSLCWAAAA